MDNKEDAIIASCLSKLVFKKGRLTIPPEIMLQASGLLPPRPSDLALIETHVLPAPKEMKLSQQIFDIPFKFFETADLLVDSARNALSPEPISPRDKSRSGSPDGTEGKTIQWSWAKVEEERIRGLTVASKLQGLDGLAGEFTAEADALGKHSDLWWFLGLTY